MTDAVKDDEAIIYVSRREFLSACMTETRNRYTASVSGAEAETYYGFAKTELQFRRALCDLVFPTVKKLKRDELMKLMSEELTAGVL